MANIVGIGIAAVDIINVTDGYPVEDDEVRALRQTIRRGGNATNSLVVLSQLGHQCEWLGTLADDVNSQVISTDLTNNKIQFSHCQRYAQSKTPTSYITLNRINGSRTIVHYRELPELTASAIKNIDMSQVQWIHFEGRNVTETRAMMDYIKQRATDILVSIEIEKPREQLELLLSGADVYFFSRAFAGTQHLYSAEALLKHYRATISDATLVCTWGEDGAYALEKDQLFHAPAVTVPKVIDTIGAGDTFNAGFIHARLKGDHTPSALTYACRLASKKCGIDGFSGLKEQDS